MRSYQRAELWSLLGPCPVCHVEATEPCEPLGYDKRPKIRRHAGRRLAVVGDV